MADKEEIPVPLPSAQVRQVAKGISLLSPLSRRGHGPGLVVITPNIPLPTPQNLIQQGTPPPITKWAEEGYTVIEIRGDSFQPPCVPSDILDLALRCLDDADQRDHTGGIGLICYETSSWNIMSRENLLERFTAAVVYTDKTHHIARVDGVPVLYHSTTTHDHPTSEVTDLPKFYTYGQARSSLFAIPGHSSFDYRLESLSHTRNLKFLKEYMNGPFFDLEAIWEEHTYHEFDDRSVAKTMGTMVQEPYVNHIPTLTGGIGRESLTKFYRNHFIWNNPDDIYNRLVSRTVGIDRICDEFVMELTHDKMIDWLLPGIPPTGKKLRIPFVSVVNIRGDRLYHEHITWDQASTLAQLGLLPEYLPFPYTSTVGSSCQKNVEIYYRLPVAGVEGAIKMIDKDAIASNKMMEYDVKEKKNDP